MSPDCDVLVIGSGAGGGTFAYACARAGRRVLLMERGEKHVLKAPVHDEQRMLIEKRPYDDRPVGVNGTARRLYMGGVLGGGTSLYGAALVRPSVDDFHPGKHYGQRLPRALWDWPIDYDALEPYYTEAEQLYEVTGPSDGDFGPLGKPHRGFPHAPIPMKPINQRLMAATRARGLKPFSLPLAIDFDRCLECSVCPGYVCVNGARRSSAHLVDRAVREGLPLDVLTGLEAERFERDSRGQVAGLHARELRTGRRVLLCGRSYALAAGAIHSPALLLRSGMGGQQVGRNYMMHLNPLAVGFFARATGADRTFVKQLGFADFYFGTKSYPHKLGLVQSLPVPGPRMIAKATTRHLPLPVAHFLRSRMIPLAGIVEDLPDPANRVELQADGQARLQHRFGAYDMDRGRQLGRFMTRILKSAGALCCSTKSFASEEHVAHQCGTLRFGTDPTHAVVAGDGRLFGQPNLFVVDGSVLPTSLGVGPALTIMANALRVAREAVQAR
jgi:choline dehydrogenase-like flavoprotein